MPNPNTNLQPLLSRQLIENFMRQPVRFYNLCYGNRIVIQRLNQEEGKILCKGMGEGYYLQEIL